MNDLETKFLLLSAYLDEVADVQEQRQVEEWLRSDAQFQQLYAHQLKLRQGLQSLPVLDPIPPEVLIKNVMVALDRRQQSKRLFGIGAVGATLLLLVGSMITIASNNRNTPAPSLLTNNSNSSNNSEPLMIALERPIVPLPNALDNP